jgi:DNA-binding transcriptional LysR family regulator
MPSNTAARVPPYRTGMALPHNPRMDLKQMQYFVAVAEEGNLSRAALRLRMSQPPLTRQIQALERELDTELFVRTPKGVELTAAGRALLQEAPNVLALARRAADTARRAGRGLVGELDVGTFGSAVLNVIPALLARFHRIRPDVKIRLHNMTKAEQIQALRERRIAIGFNRLVPDEPDLVVETVLRERMLVGLPAGHPLCRKPRVRIRDLDGEPMILYPNLPMAGLAQEVIGAFVREGARIVVEQEVEDAVTCIALVASGFGLCVTTESAANLRLPGVEYRPLESEFLKDIGLACIWRRGDDAPILHAFLAVAREASSVPLRRAAPPGGAPSVRKKR